MLTGERGFERGAGEVAGALKDGEARGGVEFGGDGGETGGEAVGDVAPAGVPEGVNCIGVGRSSIGTGIITPGEGVSTWRRPLCGPGLIGRTGSIIGAWARARGDWRGLGVSSGVDSVGPG